jgi:hypothetical protein
VALKLNALVRVNVLLYRLMDVKLPTAYMVPPHWASCRTCSVVPVGASWGVPAAGVEDTGPVAADAGPATRPMLPASAPAPKIAATRHLPRHI